MFFTRDGSMSGCTHLGMRQSLSSKWVSPCQDTSENTHSDIDTRIALFSDQRKHHRLPDSSRDSSDSVQSVSSQHSALIIYSEATVMKSGL